MREGSPHPGPLPGGEGVWIPAFAGMTSCAKISLRGNDGAGAGGRRSVLCSYGLVCTYARAAGGVGCLVGWVGGVPGEVVEGVDWAADALPVEAVEVGAAHAGRVEQDDVLGERSVGGAEEVG